MSQQNILRLQTMFLPHSHCGVYYCIGDQAKFQIFNVGGEQNVLSEAKSILLTFPLERKT